MFIGARSVPPCPILFSTVVGAGASTRPTRSLLYELSFILFPKHLNKNAVQNKTIIPLDVQIVFGILANDGYVPNTHRHHHQTRIFGLNVLFFFF